MGVEIGQRLVGLGLELGDFLLERRQIALLRDRAQFIETGVDVGDRRLEAGRCAVRPRGDPPLGVVRPRAREVGVPEAGRLFAGRAVLAAIPLSSRRGWAKEGDIGV